MIQEICAVGALGFREESIAIRSRDQIRGEFMKWNENVRLQLLQVTKCKNTEMRR